MKFLGLDVGTGGSRAVVIDASGRIYASATVEHEPFASPQLGWAEQNPDDWWRASATAIRTVLRKTDAEEIKAVGLSGQMHGAVLLDFLFDDRRNLIDLELHGVLPSTMVRCCDAVRLILRGPFEELGSRMNVTRRMIDDGLLQELQLTRDAEIDLLIAHADDHATDDIGVYMLKQQGVHAGSSTQLLL